MPRIHEFRDRIAEWAAQHHREDLIAGIHALIGQETRNQQDVTTAIAFALVAPPDEGPSLIERYVAQAGRMPRAERVLLQQWENTWFSVVRVCEIMLDQWVEIHDVVRERRVRVRERSATHHLAVGTWLAVFYYETDQQYEFEGTIRVIAPQSRIYAVQAAQRAYSALGVEPRVATPAVSRRTARPVMAAINRANRPPRLVNADGHDIELITVSLGLSWEELVAVLQRWPDAAISDDHADYIGLQPVQATGGPAVRAGFSVDKGVVTVFTNSRHRYDELRTRWLEQTGAALPVLREEIEATPSDRDGNPIVVDNARVPEGEAEALMAEHAEQWLDQEIPALGGLTPHEAVEEGRRAEVWALLAEDEVGEVQATVLGLVLPERQGR